MSTCAFDEATHTYTRDGVILPSVTTIIGACWPRSDNAPQAMIDRAGVRGAWVDAALMKYLTMGTVEIPEGTSQEYVDCLGHAIDWWEAERGGAKVECQVRLYGQREAGTADLVVDDHEILDLKSTWDISKTVAAQLGGYSTLREESGKFSDCLGVLHVRGGKSPKKAAFIEIDYFEGCRQWKVIRDYWRLMHAA